MSKREHRVTFLSPGTMFDETSSKTIGKWDHVAALKLAADIMERHGARPYGFYFETYLTADPVPDGEGGVLEVRPKSIAKSGTYYIDGELRTVDSVASDAIPRESILLSNMRGNDYPIVCQTLNGYSHVSPFEKGDFVVARNGTIVERGDDQKHVEYRARKIAEHRQGV